jgi:hypothetical protein
MTIDRREFLASTAALTCALGTLPGGNWVRHLTT